MTHQTLLDFGPNAGYLTELYQLYLSDPSMVDPSWAQFFSTLEPEKQATNGYLNGHSNGHANGAAAVAAAPAVQEEGGQGIAEQLIAAFRRFGHTSANLSPFQTGGIKPEPAPELRVESYGDSTGVRLARCTLGGKSYGTVEELLSSLRAVYSSTIGFEIEHLTNGAERTWLQERIEQSGGRFIPTKEHRLKALEGLVKAEIFESELHRTYVGAKRFSVEGNESLLPSLYALLFAASRGGVKHAVFGMAHRGRLNVLANILGKPLELIFSEFDDQTVATAVGGGDVKYHLGFDSTYTDGAAPVSLSLVPNPSHLEFVNPVVEGVSRALQDTAYGRDRRAVLPVVMHGDAAAAGQGIVFETINFSQLSGYLTGGTVHIVINNQIGFTTTPDESRSTRYCTDLAKGIDVPVFHVNGDDPDAVWWVTELAVDYRNTFGKDVFIDLIGLRKYGHNEGDDPSFTQPLTYAELKGRPLLWQSYGERLARDGVCATDHVGQVVGSYKEAFAAAKANAKPQVSGPASSLQGRLRDKERATAVDVSTLNRIGRALGAFPPSFVPHPKLGKIIEKRVESVESGEGIEWGVAEALAFGSLILEGRNVRLSGQDCWRGTFSQRHLMLDHYERPEVWSPLGTLAAENAGSGTFEVYNSPLSEAAVVGFEFGYSHIAERALVLWEAQFGDFSNGAQVLIDQFVSSSESKWWQFSGVTLLLPHAFEGQGPEHSSARLERYLQLCAEGNMTVCYCSTAAQHFHMLRRQGLCEVKRPLIVMTPKSLLRLPGAAATIKELAEGRFNPILVDEFGKGTKSDTVILTSGKVYHDIAQALTAREGSKVKSVRVIRVEQLYPFPAAEIKAALKQAKAKDVVWVQEEPHNQGAWSFIDERLRSELGVTAEYIGRAAAAATATGSPKAHAREQKEILTELLKRV
jgi:2-oxoglutarate dehydrogenase E1 component